MTRASNACGHMARVASSACCQLSEAKTGFCSKMVGTCITPSITALRFSVSTSFLTDPDRKVLLSSSGLGGRAAASGCACTRLGFEADGSPAAASLLIDHLKASQENAHSPAASTSRCESIDRPQRFLLHTQQVKCLLTEQASPDWAFKLTEVQPLRAALCTGRKQHWLSRPSSGMRGKASLPCSSLVCLCVHLGKATSMPPLQQIHA